MQDREKLEAILQIVKSNFGGPEVVECEDLRGDGPGRPGDGRKRRDRCETPFLALYFIWTDCVTVNNGACPEWEFCDHHRGPA